MPLHMINNVSVPETFDLPNRPSLAEKKADEALFDEALALIKEKNALLMQIYADVLNCEIHISGTEQTAALGAAIYASVAAGKDLGGYETIQEAVANMSHLKDIVYKPNPPMVEKYVELYQMYCNLVEMFNPQKNTTMITLSQLH